MLTSDKREHTIQTAFEVVKENFTTPVNGPNTGPVIDDSASEGTAINKAWPSALVLLCTLHFLQRRWAWLQDGQDKNDCLILIEILKNMVYANSESALESHYHKLLQTCPHAILDTLQHLQSVW